MNTSQKDRIVKITKKYLSGRFSPKTEEKVQRWLIKDENLKEKESASLEYWNSLNISPSSKTYSALDRVNKRIEKENKKPTKIPFHRQLSRIAAVLIPLFIIGGGYLYYQTARNNMMEIHVAYGKEKHLFLPDSSEIWINSGSIVKYPKEFNGDKRIIELNGEAYFSVKRDETKPFVVNTERLSVNVLGTKFNVKAYSNEEQVTTTLTSGKIEVNSEKQSQVLKPNEQLNFNKATSTISIIDVPPSETNAWLTGQLIFTNASIKDILKTLERKFNIPIEDKTSISTTKLYTVKFLQNESIYEVLTILEDIADTQYQIKGKQITVFNNE